MHDLNLARILIAVVETSSVSAAAKKLNLSQPSVSHGIARLRDLTGDALFVRNRNGVTPTARATQIYYESRLPLRALDNAFFPQPNFDPASSQAAFVLALTDLGEMTFIPPIVSHLRRVAPGLRLEIVPLTVPNADDWLRTGKVDLVLGNISPSYPDTRFITLFEEEYACIASSTHPRIGASLTIAEFLREGHAVVVSGSGHWQTGTSELSDDIIGRIEPQIVLKSRHFVVLPDIVETSDLVATLPSRSARFFAKRRGITFHPLPFDAPRFNVNLLWRDRPSSNPSLTWLIEAIQETLARI
ncbi:MAG TPA: LysR family transcriptional regulator [Ancylobacter sp.]